MFLKNYEEYKSFVKGLVDESIEKVGKKYTHQYAIESGASQAVVSMLFTEVEMLKAVISKLEAANE